MRVLHDVKCTVTSIEGECPVGYKVGDHFFIKGPALLEAGQPKGICLHADLDRASELGLSQPHETPQGHEVLARLEATLLCVRDDAESTISGPGVDDYNESTGGRPDGDAAVVGLGAVYVEGAEREP